MAFKMFRGKSHIEWYPKQASTAFVKDSIVGEGGTSGTIKPATSSTTEHIGIILVTIAATDTDYALTTMVPVLVPDVDAELIADCDTTDAAASQVATKVDLANSYQVDADASSVKAFEITGVVSTSVVIGKLIKGVTSHT